MALLSTTYCTEAELVRFLSSSGVDAFADHDNDGVRDVEVVNDCINQATEEIDAYARQQYAQADLDGSTIINRWCVTLSAYFLCMRRGNQVPDSLANEVERILNPDEGLLKRIADNRYQIPGIAKRADLRPTWSNLDVDRRHRRSTVRVTKTNSSDAPTALTQDETSDVAIPD